MTARNLTKLVLLLSLVVSCGEGISLFPFPAIDRNVSEAGSHSISPSAKQRYHYAARRLGSPTKLGNGTTAKSRHDAGVIAGPAAGAEPELALAGPFRADKFDWPALHGLSGALTRYRSRGPPNC
ncbi:MAG: hypothetical protein AB7F88_11205 [Pyrinomonadaceae bacterium]